MDADDGSEMRLERGQELGQYESAVHSDADGVQNWPDWVARKLTETE